MISHLKICFLGQACVSQDVKLGESIDIILSRIATNETFYYYEISVILTRMIKKLGLY